MSFCMKTVVIPNNYTKVKENVLGNEDPAI